MGLETYIDAEGYLSLQVGSDGAILLNCILFHLYVFWKIFVKDFKCTNIEIIVSEKWLEKNWEKLRRWWNNQKTKLMWWTDTGEFPGLLECLRFKVRPSCCALNIVPSVLSPQSQEIGFLINVLLEFIKIYYISIMHQPLPTSLTERMKWLIIFIPSCEWEWILPEPFQRTT